MDILAFPVQLALHVLISYAVAHDSFHFLAGYDGKTAYRTEEVKTLLVQIDLLAGIKTTLVIFIMAVLSCLSFMPEWLGGALVYVYTADFLGTVLYLNESMIDRIYCHEEDAARAKRGIPVTALYVILLAAQMGLVILVSNWKHIENNTAPALWLGGLAVAEVFFSTIGYLLESRRIKKTSDFSQKYRPGTAGVLCLILTLALMAGTVLVCL